jgi:hypothetical protein
MTGSTAISDQWWSTRRDQRLNQSRFFFSRASRSSVCAVAQRGNVRVADGGGVATRTFFRARAVRAKNSQYWRSLNHPHLKLNNGMPVKCEGVDGELGERLVRRRVGFAAVIGKDCGTGGVAASLYHPSAHRV